MVKTITDNRCDLDRPGALGSMYTFEYFDWSANLASYTNPEGFTVNYDYNTGWNRKSQIMGTDFADDQVYKVDYTYDLAGRLTNVIDSNSLDPLYVAGFDYDANGNRTLLDYYLEGTTEGHTYGMDYTHNADNFLKTIVTTSTTTGAPTFVFDANDVGDIDGLGRLVQADETIYPDTSGVSHAFDYAYDMMSQLTSAKATDIDGLDWLQEDFTYNKDGNVTDYDVTGSDSSSAAADYSYTNSGVSDIMAGAAGDGAFSLSNDLNGNTTRLPTSGANDVVEYNWDNKLRSAQKGDFSIWVKYDPMGNRVWRQSDDGEDTTTMKFVVDISGSLPTIIAEYSDPNSLANQYIYADAQILCQYVGHDDPNVTDQTYYYVHDRLGSVRLVVDCNMVDETVTARNIYTYSPFGNPYAGTVTEAVYNPFQFTGQWFDEEINQYYLRARMYDPTMMRFTTREVAQGEYERPLTLHRYLYCLNDPINYVDLNGLWAMYLSVQVSGAFAWGTQAQFMFAWDDDGNYGMFFSPGFGAGTPSLGYAYGWGVTSADTIYQLEGVGATVGLSAGPVGAEFVVGSEYLGFEVQWGYGLLPETHGMITDTILLFDIDSEVVIENLIEAAINAETYGEARGLLNIAGLFDAHAGR
jgi:RHS repeat-associated protein